MQRLLFTTILAGTLLCGSGCAVHRWHYGTPRLDQYEADFEELERLYDADNRDPNFRIHGGVI